MKKNSDISKEIIESLKEFRQHHEGKITLRTHVFEKKSRLKINATTIRSIRATFHMSRNVFALHLRVSPRTLEKWEQGETIPNDQAAALLLMLKKYPDTLKRLEEI